MRTEQERTQQKAEFLTVLNKCLGIVALACEQTGVPRRTYYNWYETDEDFRAAVDEVLEVRLDFVESRLLENIKNGDTTSIIFYLKTKGKKRGYNEKNTLAIEAAQPQGGTLPALPGSKRTKKERDKLIKNKKDYYVRLLKKEGKYTAELSAQVTIAAELRVSVDELKEMMADPGYQRVNVEYSREGHSREIVNPLEKLYLDYTDRLSKSLKALGMNTDSKERKVEEDGFTDFMSQFKEE